MVAATKTSCKMASTLCRKWFYETWVFDKNLKILYILEHMIWFKFHKYVVQIHIK